MKTIVFKKVLSVLCVISLILSVCVVGFAGAASAASATYTLYSAGQKIEKVYETGDTLEQPITPNTAVKFLGWYDVDGTQHTVAGAATTLYAKYDGVVQSFDVLQGYYDPNGKFGNTGSGNMSILADPFGADSANDKVLRYDNAETWSGVGFTPAQNANGGAIDGVKIEEGKRYVISFKAAVQDLPDTAEYRFTVYATKREGVSVDGNKTGLNVAKIFKANTDGWVNVNIVTNKITAAQAAYPYLYITGTCNALADGVGQNKGYGYIDDIAITELVESDVTFNDKGNVTTESYNVGSPIPRANGASFIGWYDETFTTRYDFVPPVNTTVYARYNGTFLTFEKNGFSSADGMTIVNDPKGERGKVALASFENASIANFTPAMAEGTTKALTISSGEFRMKFRYLASNIGSNGVTVKVFSGSSLAGQITITESNSEWATEQIRFNMASAGPVTVYVECDNANTKVYLDTIDIKPFATTSSVADFEMDFENNFKWSVDNANNYTPTSGNGYVNRGKLVTEKGNTYFQMNHHDKMNAYYYFTLNDGNEQFKIVPGGLYTVEFKYYVVHSETPTEIGVLAAAPTMISGTGQTPLTVVDSFNFRDDSGWTTASVTVYADTFETSSYTTLGIYLMNTTNVPVQFCTTVNFDDIKVVTHSSTGEDSLVVFDTKGGDYEIEPMVVENGYSLATVPTVEKFGYNFKGWRYLDKDGNEKVFDDTVEVSGGILNVYAAWELKNTAVELTFKSNVKAFDDANYTAVAFRGKAVKGIPSDPTALGQTFIGWYLDTGFTKPLDPNCAPNESCTVYAKWVVQGIVIDFEQYDNVTHGAAKLSDRYSLKTVNGSKVLCYDLSAGSNRDPNGAARAMFYNGETYISAFAGLEYTISFDYYIVKCKEQGQFQIYTSDPSNTWSSPVLQSGVTFYSEATADWTKGHFSYTCRTSDEGEPVKVLSLAVSGDSIVYFDNFVIECPENAMNHYGTAVMLDANGGTELNTISGTPGTKLTLPTPKRAGFIFTGWYTDSKLTERYTATVYPDKAVQLYAGWKLGKITESFEKFPTSIRVLGVSGAYKFYNKDSVGYDASNIRTGSFSLFRNGATTGEKSFTLSRNKDVKLTIGSDYTLTMWVKPVDIKNSNSAISMSSLPTFTEIGKAEIIAEIAKVSTLTVGEWQQITYHFTAEAEYIAITTGDGVDMYIDDIELTLDGYTGTQTGDTSVSPVIVLAIVFLCAGALLLTAKKVFD